MVGQMTYGKRQWEELDGDMRKLIPVVTSSADEMIKMIDDDTDAFNDYMVSFTSVALTMILIFHNIYIYIIACDVSLFVVVP